MSEQLTLFEVPKKEKQVNHRRNWENAFQKWSNSQGIEAETNTTGYGCCGYGSMCDWCTDNSYGRPCVRALNTMLRAKGILLDYKTISFEKVWQGNFK